MATSITSSGLLAKIWSRIEIVLAVVLLTACVWQTGRMMGAMATSSLWTDEYGTVGTFSSKGPGRVLTDYRTAKNHVFFNLLNSVLPGRESFNPARVRMLSIAAAGVFALGLVAYGVWRRTLFESAVVLTLWTFSIESLKFNMEGRGYGFLVLAGLVSFIGVVEYFRTDRRTWLYTAAGAVVLGAYTVPGFLFYGGPLLLLVWVVRRNKLTFIVGAAAALAIALLYLPVAPQIVAAFNAYGDKYGEDFKDAHSLTRALYIYLLAVSPGTAWVFIGGLVVAAVFAGLRWPERRGLLVVMGAALAFFGVLLILRTSPIRMANMGWVPFALAGIFAAGACVRALPLGVRVVVFAAVAGWLLVRIAPEVREFRFEPHEDWMLAGRVAEQAFPVSMGIEYLDHAKYLLYTIKDSKKRSVKFDERAYLAGEIVVVDGANVNPGEFSRGREFHRPDEEPHNATIEVPGGGRTFFYTFRIPHEAVLTDAPAELTDREVKTGRSLTGGGLTLPEQALSGGQSVIFLLQGDAKRVRLSAKDATTGEDLAREAIVATNSIIVPIPGKPGESRKVNLTLSSDAPDVSVVEAWATPAR